MGHIKADYKESYFWMELAAQSQDGIAAIHDRDAAAAPHLTAAEIAELKARAALDRPRFTVSIADARF